MNMDSPDSHAATTDYGRLLESPTYEKLCDAWGVPPPPTQQNHPQKEDEDKDDDDLGFEERILLLLHILLFWIWIWQGRIRICDLLWFLI